jgi:hypothetical protein
MAFDNEYALRMHRLVHKPKEKMDVSKENDRKKRHVVIYSLNKASLLFFFLIYNRIKLGKNKIEYKTLLKLKSAKNANMRLIDRAI